MPEPAPQTTEEKLSAQLKEILPKLISAKDLLAKVDPNAEGVKGNEEKITSLQEELKNVQGSITDLGRKQIEIGGKIIPVQNSGLSKEQKIDFAKYICTIFKNALTPSMDNVKAITEIFAKYSKAALNTGTNSQGGYGVPDPFDGEIWREAKQASIALRECLIKPITSGNKLPVVSEATGVSVVWTDEAAGLTESEPTFGKNEYDAKKLSAYSKTSNELLEDEEFQPGLTDYLIQIFGEAVGEEIDNQAFNGSGAPFTGILNTVGVNTITMAAGDGAFEDVTFDYLSQMIAAIAVQSTANAKFVLHRTILDALRRKQSTSGGYLWNSPNAGDPGTIWGYPYIQAEKMPGTAATAVSTPFAFFGNMKKYVIGEKTGFQVMISKELLMLTDQTVIAIRRRIAEGMGKASFFSVLKTNAVDS